MSVDTPTDLDMLEAFFGEGEWMLPDEPPWDGDFLDARALVARLRAEVERLESRVLTVEEDAARKIMELSEPASFERAERLTREIGTLESEVGGLELALIQEQQAAAAFEADVERLTVRSEFTTSLAKTQLATIERLTAERDAIWAERVEEGKVAARAGREAARLRERVAVLESPERAAVIISAWLKANGPMRERDGFAYTIAENLTAPEVLNGLGDDGWRFLAGDFSTVDVGDLDLAAIHDGSPTGATHARCSPNIVAQLHRHVAEARREAQVWRTRRWGDPTGKHKFPWEDGSPTGATSSEPGKHAKCTPTSHCGGDDCPGAARDW